MVYGREVLAGGPTFQTAARAGAAIRVRFTSVAEVSRPATTRRHADF